MSAYAINISKRSTTIQATQKACKMLPVYIRNVHTRVRFVKCTLSIFRSAHSRCFGKIHTRQERSPDDQTNSLLSIVCECSSHCNTKNTYHEARTSLHVHYREQSPDYVHSLDSGRRSYSTPKEHTVRPRVLLALLEK